LYSSSVSGIFTIAGIVSMIW